MSTLRALTPETSFAARPRGPACEHIDSAMILDTVLTVTPADLSRLGPDDAVRFTAELLWAEAARVGLPLTSVNISSRIHVPDGGVDAAVNVDTPPASGILRGGKNVLQVKAGEFKPWQKSQIRRELFGKRPVFRESLGQPARDCMDSDGQYVLLCTGVDLQQRNAIRPRHFSGTRYARAITKSLACKYLARINSSEP